METWTTGLYFFERWTIGSKADVDQGHSGWMGAPSSCAFTPDGVPADRAWEAHIGDAFIEVPEVHARHNWLLAHTVGDA